MSHKDLLSELSNLDDSGFWGQIGGVFDRMTIAEDEIEKARSRHPECSDRLWGSFKILCASRLSRYPDVIYRAHCVELLTRVVNDEDTRLGTKSEVMVSLAQASLVSPLALFATSLYARLFLEIFPGKEDIVQDVLNPSLWVCPDDVDELLGTLRCEASVDDRVLKE